MVRTDFQRVTEAKTFGKVAYATIGDLIIGLENLKKERQGGGVNEIDYEGLRRTIEQVLKRDDIRLFGEAERIDGLIQELRQWSDETAIETAMEVTPETGEMKMESQAVDPYILQQLLRDLDEYEAKFEPGKEAERLANKYNLPVQTVKGLMARKIELLEQKRMEVLGKDSEVDPRAAEVVADELSDAQMVMEAEAKKAGWSDERIDQIRERVEETVLAKVEGKSMIQKGLDGSEVRTEEKRRLNEVIDETATRIAVDKKTIEVITEMEGDLAIEINEKQRGQVGELLTRAMSGEIPSGIAETEIVGVLQTSQPLAVRQAVEVMLKFGAEHPEMAKGYQLMGEKVEIVAEFETMNPEMTGAQRTAVQEYVEAYVGWQKVVPQIQASVEGVEKAEEAGEGVALSEQPTRTQIEQELPRIKTLAQVIKTPQGAYQKILAIRSRLEKAGVKVPVVFKKDIKFEAFERINKLIEKNQAIKDILFFAQKREAMEVAMRTGVRVAIVNTLLKVGAPKMAGAVLARIGIETIGGKAAETFARQTLLATKRFGFEKGVGLAIKVAATRTATNMATGTVGKVALEGLIAILGGAGGPPGWVITLALIALDFAWQAIKSVVGKAKELMTKITEGLGLDSPGLDNFLRENFGKAGGLVGTVGKGLGVMVMFIVGLPMLIGGVSILLIALVVVGITVGPLVKSQFFEAPQIAMLVPPAMGGGCVKVGSGVGEANCARGIPEQSVNGVDRNNYFRLTDTWKNGKNYARECFDAVVCESKAAGINPIWTLYAWLHESGASNYANGEVEDFGIHGIKGVPKNNFQAQLERFLKQDPASNCPELAATNYWLAVATWYLNGSCNPKEPNKTSGETGYEYYQGLIGAMNWVAPGVMLNSIHMSSSKGNCNPGTDKTAMAGKTFVDENGDTWICADDESYSGVSDMDVPEFNFSGEIPEGCPNGLPVSGGSFTQGPFAPNCSHEHMSSPAIDIGIVSGTEIRVTHNGVVKMGHDDIYGYYVDILGKCDGKSFYTRYAHMPGYPKIGNGTLITAGTEIGVVDNSGSSTGPHIHYHINGLDKNYFGQYLGLTEKETAQLWGCCGKWNGKNCPN